MRWFPALILGLLLAACGRGLTDTEAAFITDLKGESFDPGWARLHDGLKSPAPREVPVPPRLTCQSRLYPPTKRESFMATAHAMAIFNDVYFSDRLYLDDFLPDYPERLYLPDAMTFAHEMVHVWQWRERARTGYHPFRAALEHAASRDPYLFDPDTTTAFGDYGFEQQGAIMEEYICCKALAPEAERTARLHAMLSDVFDLPPLSEPLARDVILPWRHVEIDGICDGPPGL